MAISAYKGGKLKKHALLGTSLGVDPTRKKERQIFTDLYARAKQRAGDPEGFKAQIGREFQARKTQGAAAIGQAQKAQGLLRTELGDLRGKSVAAGELAESSATKADLLASWSGGKRIPKGQRQKMMKKAGMLEGFDKYRREELGGGPSHQRKAARQIAQGYLEKPAALTGRMTGLEEVMEYVGDNPKGFNGLFDEQANVQHRRKIKKNPRLVAYEKVMYDQEQEARAQRTGYESGISDKERRLQELQKTIEGTYKPLAQQSSVYTGFFG